MEIVYLSNGQQCYLKEVIGNKFIVNKIFEYQDDNGVWLDAYDSSLIVVDEIFKNKPIEKIDSEIKDLQSKKDYLSGQLSELENKKRQINRDIEQITKTKIANDKFIINRTELIKATDLVLFIKDRIMPLRMNSKEHDFRGLKVGLYISISNGEERSWGYKLYDDTGNSSGDYLCEKYGILINPSEGEVESTILKRVQEFKFNDYVIVGTEDKYLTPEMLIIKNEKIKADSNAKRTRLENELNKIKATIEALPKY